MKREAGEEVLLVPCEVLGPFGVAEGACGSTHGHGHGVVRTEK